MKKTMTNEEMNAFFEKVGRSELYADIRTHGTYSRYLKGIRSTLVALGYDARWVEGVFRDRMDAYFMTTEVA